MGSWLSYLWWGGDPDEVNSLSGLTRREVYAVQHSWAPVFANSVANGTELLKSFSIMGHLLSRWWWGGDPEAANPVSGLTLRQVYQIQITWQLVNADAGKYGMELFLRLFRANPESKTFFKAIRDLDEDRIRNSYQFKAHAINFMSAISLAVTNLRQPEVVVAMMDKLGESHGNRKISTKYFYETKAVLVGMLKNDLKLTSDQIMAWESFISFMYKHILDKL
ncbi:globin CTT-V-like isoform X2 [Cydia pomonella]|uniref:globin CTT-V-like isoform X2 n=1 Tax=Cydia pomonella TaxID=82600 RepID=UPI002ADD7036|nr:globin CTT-V-like isoform X2 [Cydia pomonella]